MTEDQRLHLDAATQIKAGDSKYSGPAFSSNTADPGDARLLLEVLLKHHERLVRWQPQDE